jgi:hypothetical protein
MLQIDGWKFVGLSFDGLFVRFDGVGIDWVISTRSHLCTRPGSVFFESGGDCPKAIFALFGCFGGTGMIGVEVAAGSGS